ncbi:hypothetical protein ACFSCV_03640 [Methylopila henanensis]|uniref:DUF4410 domain-containing protein n=1 Tax=Methylopila henanensis TaxID=873516 RepID=A0ABW4K1U6_9HYPH
MGCAADTPDADCGGKASNEVAAGTRNARSQRVLHAAGPQMLISLIKLAAAVLATLPLVACAGAPGIISPNEPAHISKVHVSLAPNVSTPGFAETVRARTAFHAARFERKGAPKELRVAIYRHTYKNPAMALLVTDANVVQARVSVVDVASGKVQGEVEAGAIDSVGGGVVGAIVAVAQEKQNVDQRLAEGLAKAALRHAYGSARASPVIDRDDPVAAPAARPDATPAPAPAKPAKDTPVASAAKKPGAGGG